MAISIIISLTIMQAIEAIGMVNAQGQLSLDQPLQAANPGRVRVIVLLSEDERAGSYSDQPNGDQTEQSDSQDDSAQSFLSMIDEIRAQVPDEEWKKLPTIFLRTYKNL